MKEDAIYKISSKKVIAFIWSIFFHLSQITCSWASQQPCHAVVLERGPHGKERRPTNNHVSEFGKPSPAFS